jgi:antitoxin Phd
MAQAAPKRKPRRTAATAAGPGDGDTWQLKDAKARFSELFSRALERPQRVTRHGKRAVVVLAEEEYRRLRDRGTERKNLAQFLAELPLAELDLRREDIDIFPRDIDL